MDSGWDEFRKQFRFLNSYGWIAIIGTGNKCFVKPGDSVPPKAYDDYEAAGYHLYTVEEAMKIQKEINNGSIAL